MTVAPACQLAFDVDGHDNAQRGCRQVWAGLPDVAQAQVLRLLARMIAAGMLAGDAAAADPGVVRGDG